VRIKNFDLYSLILGLSSFVVLILGLFHFDNTVAQKRALTLQISQYEIGAQVEYMRATVSGRTEAGMLIFQDFVGTKIVTDLKDDSLHLGNLVALKGKIGESRNFKVDIIEVYPSITMKIALSLLAIIVLLWKLLGRVKISSQGLILSP
tara:strand:- start:59 stop:505 length:447 start_codon:yes stop_codon:yes gene_type:complete